MPSPKELAKALAYRGEIRNTPQNSFLGGIANFLAPVSEFADRDKLPESIPLLGGMSFADLSGLKGAQSLVNDMSYGKSPISGASLQTTKVDPRVIDLAGVSGAMMPVGKALGKAALREGARQIETGTGVIGSKVMNPKMSAVPEGITSRQVRELIDKNSPGESLDFDALRSAIGGNSYKLTDYDIGKINFGDLSVDASKAMPSKGPIVIGKDGKIIDGRHRAALAKSMGDSHIKAYVPVGDNVGGAMMQRPKTEWEILHDTAQRNAALPVEQGGLGLPEGNTGMDRAAAMDWNTPAYHGTTTEIDPSFNLDYSGANALDYGKKNIWASDNPELASQYAEAGLSRNQAEAIQNSGDFNWNKKKEIPKKIADAMFKDIAEYGSIEGGGANVLPLLLRGKQSVHESYGGRFKNEMPKALWGRDLENADIAVINNVIDNPTLQKVDPSTVYAIKNPANIRSRFAAFDPFRIHEADILAGVGVGGMLDPQAIAEALRQQDRK